VGAVENFDLVVIGAGINGAGIAQAAAAGGYSVLVLEKTGIAAGASGRSSKLIHGGLRYLESADFGLVREALHERGLLLKNAPELVQLQPVHLPVYRSAARPAWMVRSGLGIYALLGGLRSDARFSVVPRAEWDTLEGLRTEGLQTVFRFFEALTDDAALTRAVMASARSFGAELRCPAMFMRLEVGAMGCRVWYTEGGRERECMSHVLVNAAGAWAAGLPRPVGADAPACENVLGTHLVLSGGPRRCYLLEAPADRRPVFVLPWREATLVGTTEHVFDGDPDEVEVPDADRDYLLDTFGHYFPDTPCKVTDAWSGLRVLPASDGAPASRSRETVLHADDPARPRLLTVYGGKLTVYRATAQKVMQALSASLPQRQAVADTSDLRLRPD